MPIIDIVCYNPYIYNNLQVGLWDLELLCHPVDEKQHALIEF